MILTYTDFGFAGPYIGEMESVLRRDAPETPIVHLMADAPAFRPGAAGRLLAALARRFAAGDVCLAVVDPGVGGPRRPAVMCADGVWFVGPDNGLLVPVAERAKEAEWWEITASPKELSRSFHGRDLFAPFAAALARGERPTGIGARPLFDPVTADAPHGDPQGNQQIIYIDGYGNAVTGIEAGDLATDATLSVDGRGIERAATFCRVAPGTLFWYENSMGLVEIAANRDNAARLLALDIGTQVTVENP